MGQIQEFWINVQTPLFPTRLVANELSKLTNEGFFFFLKNYCWGLSYINIFLFCYPPIGIPIFLQLLCNLFIQYLLCFVHFITL